ncbi:hypothetical protein [Streptomyces sp. NPDC054756]
MTNELGPSPINPDSAYSNASIYVDAEAAPRIMARLRYALDLVTDDGPELAIGPVRVTGGPNDYATGRRTHPFDFLEWPTVLECEAYGGTPAEVVQAVAAVLEALWRGGFKALVACDFEDELPARGGMDRYPYPAPDPDGRTGTWWKRLISPRAGKGRNW